MSETSLARSALLALLVVSAVGLLGVASSGAAVADEVTTTQGYTMEIVLPSELVAADNQTIGVRIDNTNGNSNLFSPVVEIPLPDGYSVDQTALNNAWVNYGNGTTAPVNTAETDPSSYRSGQAVYLFGEEVPQGETYTYYVNASIDTAGTSPLSAETRLLYNENDPNVTARDSLQATSKGYGNLTTVVERPDGTQVSDADITVNGTDVGASDGSAVVKRLQGTYTVNAVVPDAPVTLPGFTQTIGVAENSSVTYTVPTSLVDPTVIRKNQSAEVVDSSIGNVTTQTATAEQAKQVRISFLTSTSGGSNVVAVPIPGNVGPVSAQSASVDTGQLTTETHSESVNLFITSSGDVTTTVTFDGYRAGDANKNGAVDASDASSVAGTVAANGDTDRYYDVTGDGNVTAADAMYIAQYDEGNRTADYSGGN